MDMSLAVAWYNLLSKNVFCSLLWTLFCGKFHPYISTSHITKIFLYKKYFTNSHFLSQYHDKYLNGLCFVLRVLPKSKCVSGWFKTLKWVWSQTIMSWKHNVMSHNSNTNISLSKGAICWGGLIYIGKMC